MNKVFRSLFFWEALSFAVAFAGSRAMSESSMLWYRELSRSSLTPPDIAFPIVWAFLYALMGYSAYRVVNRASAGVLIHILSSSRSTLPGVGLFSTLWRPQQGCSICSFWSLPCFGQPRSSSSTTSLPGRFSFHTYCGDALHSGSIYT